MEKSFGSLGLFMALSASLTACGERTVNQTETPVVQNILPPSAPVGCEGDCLINVEDDVSAWNRVLLDRVRANRLSPPVASRAMALMHTAVFDAVNSIDAQYAPYLTKLDGYQKASVEVAIAAAAHGILIAIFPQDQAMLDVTYNTALVRVHDDEARRLGTELGARVVDLAWSSRQGDMGWVIPWAELPKVYGAWQPTLPGFAPFLLPEWGTLRPFALQSGSQFRKWGPPALNSPAFAASLEQVRTLGAKTGSARTNDQTQIANFWADGAGTVTPPGHWNEIARTVIQTRSRSIVDTARYYALLDMALADAAIAAWDMKYHFNAWRPIQAVRDSLDPNWLPLLDTPNFPEYVSGHSTFSGAAAQVLAQYFGGEQNFVIASDGTPGIKRSFASFTAAANEAGMSRIYGGIHFDFSNVDGLATGRDVGAFVFGHQLQRLAH